MAWQRRVLLLIPALIAAIVYWPATHFGYLWDDQLILLKPPQYHRDWLTLVQHVADPFLIGLPYFRPLPLLTLGAEQLLFGGQPFVPHLDALLLHAANSSLVALLGWLCSVRFDATPRRAVACGVIAGLVYALHPALLEAAAWICVRFDTLMTFFVLLALVADRSIRATPIRAAVVALLFLAAALCKEMAIGWALTLPFWHAMFTGADATWRARAREYVRAGHVAVYVGIAIAGVVYLAMRALLQEQPVHAAVSSAATLGGSEHFALVLKSLGKYVALTAWPFATVGHLHYWDPPARFSELDTQTGLAALALFPLLAWLALRRSQQWAAALPCCLALSLLPVLNVIPLHLGDNYVQDRFLTLPLAFFAVWLALICDALLWSAMRLRGLAAGLVLVVWLALSILNISVRLPNWKDDLSFSFMEYSREPESHSGALDLQQAFLEAGRFREAAQFSEQLRQQQSGQLFPPQQIGYAYALGELGAVEDGIANMQQALSGLPDVAQNAELIPTAHALLGELYLRAGQPDEAAQHLRLALDRYDSAETRYFLGLAELAAGRETEGHMVIEQALSDTPPIYREARRAQIAARLQGYREAIERRSGP